MKDAPKAKGSPRVQGSLMLKGAGFSPYINMHSGISTWALAPAECIVSGHDFSRAANVLE
jgi:hypothetical protein